MKIFEHIENKDFFKPLTSVNQQLYCDAADVLNAAAMERGNVTEAEARAYIGMMLSGRDDIPDSYEASIIYKKLRDCGWIDEPEIGPGGKPLMILNDDSVALMTFLHELVDAYENLNAYDIQNLHHMASLLATADDAYPYRHFIQPMAQYASTLRAALSSLRRNARNMILDVVSQKSLGELVGYTKETAFGDIFSEYFFIKKHGFTSQYFTDVIDWIREFMADKKKMMRAAEEYANRHDPDMLTAEEHVRDILLTIIEFLHSQFDDLMDDIDDIIDQCWRRINVQLVTYLTTGVDDRALMANIMKYMKELPSATIDEILSRYEQELDVFDFDIVDESSVDLIRKKKVITDECYLEESALTEEDIARDNALLEADSRNNLYQGFEFVDRCMDSSGVFVPGPADIKTKDDVFAMAHLLCFARTPNERYKVEYTGKRIRTDYADITGVIVTKNEEW